MEFSSKELKDILLESAYDVAKQELEDTNNLEISEESELFGSNSLFDSLMLVSFVLNAEKALERKYGAKIKLADERAMEQEVYPFSSISALAGYVGVLLGEV